VKYWNWNGVKEWRVSSVTNSSLIESNDMKARWSQFPVRCSPE